MESKACGSQGQMSRCRGDFLWKNQGSHPLTAIIQITFAKTDQDYQVKAAGSRIGWGSEATSQQRGICSLSTQTVVWLFGLGFFRF
jgi:hypothetical protein